MSTYEYHQLLKFLYFEGYVDSYKEAEYMIEEMEDDEFDSLCEEVFGLDEETEEEKRRNERRARIAELQAQGRVMTSSKRTSQRAKARREEEKAERLEKLANSALETTRGVTRRSLNPMGSGTQEVKPEAPKANRRLSSSVRRDTLASRADDVLRSMRNESYEIYDIALSYLLDEGYAETEEAAEVIFENMSDEWLDDIIEDAASYARRQANKQARGRVGKTELYTTRTSGKVVKGDDGKLSVERTTSKKMSEPAQMGKFRSGATGRGPGIQGGGHGGREMGYTPAKHSTGGIHRGVKKSEQQQPPERKLNPYQRKRAVQTARQQRTGGATTGYAGLVGGRAAERMRERSKKSFGSWSASQNNK